jgi:hypothetical protein
MVVSTGDHIIMRNHELNSDYIQDVKNGGLLIITFMYTL